MTSAMERHSGGVADYRASEGKTVSVPYKGAVRETLREILGGVRSACTYVGAARLKELESSYHIYSGDGTGERRLRRGMMP